MTLKPAIAIGLSWIAGALTSGPGLVAFILFRRLSPLKTSSAVWWYALCYGGAGVAFYFLVRRLSLRARVAYVVGAASASVSAGLAASIAWSVGDGRAWVAASVLPGLVGLTVTLLALIERSPGHLGDQS